MSVSDRLEFSQGIIEVLQLDTAYHIKSLQCPNSMTKIDCKQQIYIKNDEFLPISC